MFKAVVYVLTSGCAWRHLPETFGVSLATAHRRFTAWTRAGLWRRLHRAVLDELGARGELDWASAIVDPASVRAKGGTLTGPTPVDRGKKGSKLHVLSEAQGIPLAVAVSGANTHDSLALKPLIRGIPAVRSRRGPRRRGPVELRADKAYFSAEHLTWLRERGLVPRIARPGIESSERLGRHRWKIERSIAWLPLAHRPVRAKGISLPRLPRPRSRPHLLQEARETRHVRHPLSRRRSWRPSGG